MDSNCTTISMDSKAPGVIPHLQALGYFGWIVTCFGGISTLTLIALYISNVVKFIKFMPPHRRLLLCWVTSMPLVMCFLGFMTVLIPRAGNLCDTVKQIFLPFIMMHFIDLTLDFKGGQNAALDDLLETNTPLNLRVPPCCCFGFCFNQLSFTKKRLRLIKAMVYQMPLIQLIIIVLTVLLTEAEVIRRDQGPDGTFMFLSILNIVCFCFAMWAFNIITRAFVPHLINIRYRYKAQLVGLSIPIFKIQNFILAILTATEVIPCVTTVLSRIVLQKSIDASLTILESFILGIFTYIEYDQLCKQQMTEPSFADNHRYCGGTKFEVYTTTYSL